MADAPIDFLAHKQRRDKGKMEALEPRMRAALAKADELIVHHTPVDYDSLEMVDQESQARREAWARLYSAAHAARSSLELGDMLAETDADRQTVFALLASAIKEVDPEWS